jgi:hypothetical protein
LDKSGIDSRIGKEVNTMEVGNVLNQEKNKSGTLFQKVQGAMRSLPDFAETCKAILDVVIDQMDAENCSLMLRDPISGELIFVQPGKGGREASIILAIMAAAMGSGLSPERGLRVWFWKKARH